MLGGGGFGFRFEFRAKPQFPGENSSLGETMNRAMVPATIESHAMALPERPTLMHSFFELRFPIEAGMLWMHAINHPWPRVSPANRRTVMLIPGFMAGDTSLALLASFLRWLGHRTEFAGIRSNSNCPRDTLHHLGRRLAQISKTHNTRVTIVGQSLGGTYARELSARHPELIDQVITLGSPIRLVRDAANPVVVAAARWIAMLRQLRDGCLTEACACGLQIAEKEDEQVPTTVIFSRTDGVVHWTACVDRTGSPLVSNVEVMASHVGMGFNADVYRIVADHLARPSHYHAQIELQAAATTC